MASERRPAPNQALDLLQTLLETPLPLPAAQHPLGAGQHRALPPATSQDSLVLLQALLNTPVGPRDERRPPVALRSIPQHPARLARPAPTRFDTLLLRSSQALSIGAVMILGYWFVRVPLNNWMHPRPAPMVRSLGALPSPFATRVAPTKAAGLVALAVPDAAASARHNKPTAAPVRASALPLAISAEARANTPIALPVRASALPLAVSAEARADTPSMIDLPRAEQVVSPTLAVKERPAEPSQATASPVLPSPTTAFMWPTIAPVQLGEVTKPSPAPVERKVTAVQPAGAGQPHSAAALPTRLIIPTLGLDVPIKEVFIVDNQWQVAEYAAGYLNGSGLPGVPGNLALSGHAGLYGAVFANLGALNPGDEIFVDAAGVRYRYILRTTSAVRPNQAEVLDSTATPTMTLITCTNWDTQRLIAQADFADSGPAPGA